MPSDPPAAPAATGGAAASPVEADFENPATAFIRMEEIKRRRCRKVDVCQEKIDEVGNRVGKDKGEKKKERGGKGGLYIHLTGTEAGAVKNCGNRRPRPRPGARRRRRRRRGWRRVRRVETSILGGEVGRAACLFAVEKKRVREGGEDVE